MRSRESARVQILAVACFVLALVVRLVWIFRVQSPYDAVVSDMNGYVERALALVAGTTSAYPRFTALYPFGAHYVYAAEFYVLGFEHKTAISIVQALLCASPVYFFVLFASRLFARAAAPAILGVLFAVWQPIVWCTGYFLSEVPYVALLYLNSWLCLRFVETRRGGLALGITGAFLFAIRPQFILTFALLAVLYLWTQRGRLLERRNLGTFARVLVPWLAVIAFSVGRFHQLTGSWGLISENGQLNRLFADTSVGKIEARWSAPNGDAWYFQVEPPTKRSMNERLVVKLDGYVGDPVLLAALRVEHLRDQTTFGRIYRAFNNVRLLWDKNDPWPEQAFAKTPFRRFVQRRFNDVTRWVVIPLACIGLINLRKRAPVVVVLAHVGTLVVLSMFFFPESRYRVVYDPFLLLVAAAGTRHFGGHYGRRAVAMLQKRQQRTLQVRQRCDDGNTEITQKAR